MNISYKVHYIDILYKMSNNLYRRYQQEVVYGVGWWEGGHSLRNIHNCILYFLNEICVNYWGMGKMGE